MTSAPHTLYTMLNSPYSDKIRAFLQYKRIPFEEHLENADTRFSVLQARTGKTMVPVVITPDDKAMNDSTAIAAALELAFPDPATRWRNPRTDALAMLLEDFADEWLVRIMLTSRWYHEADAAQNAAMIASGMTHGVPGLDFQRAAREFPGGITATLPKINAEPHNAEQWYAMLPRILEAMATALARSLFLTGAAPHQADFAFYGQLRQIRRDPTGSQWIAGGPGSVLEWMERVEACAGGQMAAVPSPVEDLSALAPLVAEVASTYLRMQVANAVALADGVDIVRAELPQGFSFSAPPARYNAKLLGSNLDWMEVLLAETTSIPEAIAAPLRRELANLPEHLRAGRSAIASTTIAAKSS